MAVLAMVFGLLGTVLALRFRVMILVPAIAIAFVAVLALGFVQHDSWLRIGLAIVLVTTCLEVGFLLGVGLSCFLLVTRISRLNPPLRGTSQPAARSTT